MNLVYDEGIVPEKHLQWEQENAKERMYAFWLHTQLLALGTPKADPAKRNPRRTLPQLVYRLQINCPAGGDNLRGWTTVTEKNTIYTWGHGQPCKIMYEIMTSYHIWNKYGNWCTTFWFQQALTEVSTCSCSIWLWFTICRILSNPNTYI